MKLNAIPFFLPLLLAVPTLTLYAEKQTQKKEPSISSKVALDLSEFESSSKKSRMRKTSGKKKNKKKTLSVMNYEELEAKKDQHKEAGNFDIAIKYLDQMIKLCNDINKQANNLVEMADLYFSNSDFEKAGRLYNEFSTFYPGDSQIEYASYRAILCSFYSTFDVERDQTKTEDTVQLCDKFLERSDIFTEYKDEVIRIEQQCYQKLAESEINICDFYLKRNSLKSAEFRLDGLRTTWLEKVPEIETQVIGLEIRLAEKKNDTKMTHEKKIELKKITSNVVTVAQNNKTQKMATRF